MKKILTLCCIFFVLESHCQNIAALKGFNFKNDEIYLIYRGTNAKRNLVAKDFNISSCPATHIGLGLLLNNQSLIFNVSSDIIRNGSSLICDTPFSFYDNTPDLFYGSIFSRKITIKEKKLLITNLTVLQKRKIAFDNKFTLSDDDTMYCSEFVIKMISKTYNEKYTATKLELKSFIYKKYFDSNYLLYFPVDFLLFNRKFKKESEVFLINNK